MNVDGFRADVLREPETLTALVDAYVASDGPLDGADGRLDRPRRVLFTGMGSSRFAALSAARWLRAAGVDAHVEYASATLALPPSPETLVVAISASGASEETVAALERHVGTSPTIAVTNHPERPLGHVADVALPLLAGEEVGGIACASYQCTLAVLLLLAARIAGAPAPEAELRAAVEAGAHLRDTRAAWLPRAVELLDGGDAIDVIGPDDRIAAVEQSALMLREAPRVPPRAARPATGSTSTSTSRGTRATARCCSRARRTTRASWTGLASATPRSSPSAVRSTAAGSTSRTRAPTSRWWRC